MSLIVYGSDTEYSPLFVGAVIVCESLRSETLMKYIRGRRPLLRGNGGVHTITPCHSESLNRKYREYNYSQYHVVAMPFVYKQEKKFPVIIPIILLILWMTGSTWYWVCEVKGLCTDSVVIDK